MGARTLADVLEPLSAAQLDTYRLSPSQWASVRASKSYREAPQWRLAQRGKEVRTLRSSYRSGYARFSEFVPLEVGGEEGGDERGEERGEEGDEEGGEEGDEEGGEERGEEGRAEEGAVKRMAATHGGIEGAATHGGIEGATTPVPPAPRFYTEREFASLMYCTK